MHAGGNQMQRLQERVSSLEQENSEVKLERDHLSKELVIAKEAAHDARKALEDEIQSLREGVGQRKATDALLQGAQEDQRNANLDPLA